MIYQADSTNVVNNVHTSVDSSGGNSESHTTITTTTNGKTTRVESNDSGAIHVEVKNGEAKVETSPGMHVNVTGSDTKVTGTIVSTFSGQATKSAEKSGQHQSYSANRSVFGKIAALLSKLFEKLKLPR